MVNYADKIEKKVLENIKYLVNKRTNNILDNLIMDQVNHIKNNVNNGKNIKEIVTHNYVTNVHKLNSKGLVL
jgi:hypothetical protein